MSNLNKPFKKSNIHKGSGEDLHKLIQSLWSSHETFREAFDGIIDLTGYGSNAYSTSDRDTAYRLGKQEIGRILANIIKPLTDDDND